MEKRRIDLAINGRFLSQRVTGVQRVAMELTREIDRLLSEGEDRFRVRLICQPHVSLESLQLRSIKVEVAEGQRGWIWEQTTLPLAVRNSSLLCLGNTAPVLSLLFRRKVALMIHDLSYKRFPEAYRKRYRLLHTFMLPMLIKHSDPLFTVSRTEEQILLEMAPSAAKKLKVVQNGGWTSGADVTEQTPLKLPDDYVLYVGSLSRRKNFAGLLRTATALARRDGIHFVFVGTVGRILTPVDYELPDDVRDHIHFLGQIEHPSELSAIYRRARCLVFPSFDEASAIPPLEAMHFGCPVVTSEIPAMIERCGPAAEYCDPHNIDSILAAVDRVLNDPERRNELIRLGYERERGFSWREQARSVLDAVYEAHRRDR